ncbi:predicted protein [Lichtheimia corymbifera JMRC:FSU:9682]|uniref:Uncharacterized protein n=1 Tax=Lichtheimia corymbifera JMRC:FSU:9682 TaxID=1263082 RepID=A0A068RYG5_9FUNG|nr:predicted protein [Lichtheimia corymbifera JMRC:FSU:9682]
MAASTRPDYEDDISIDDDIDTDGGYVSEGDSYYSYDAEAEWEESKAQINALFSLVIFPFVGRWLGKKFSFCVVKICSQCDSSIIIIAIDAMAQQLEANRLLNKQRYPQSPTSSSISSTQHGCHVGERR